MSLQLSVAVRNARLDAVESTIGVSPTLSFYSGAPPADCATAASGTLLGTVALPSDWMNAAGSGVKTLLGSWSGTASATGTIGYFRILQGGTCHAQGTVTATAGGGDMTLDNPVVAPAQVVTVTSFALTDGNP